MRPLVLRSLALPLIAAAASCGSTIEDRFPDNGGIQGAVCSVATGAPGAFARVTARADKDGSETSAAADAQGFADLRGLDRGSYDVVIEIAGEPARTIANLAVDVRESTRLVDDACGNVGTAAGALSGQVCNAHVGAFLSEGSVAVGIEGGEELTAAIDGEGRFALGNIPEGERVVVVSGPGYQRTHIVNIEAGIEKVLNDDDTACVTDFSSVTTGFIHGALCIPEGGGAIVGANVFIVQPIDGIAYGDAVLDDGSFHIGGVPVTSGPLQVRAEHNGASFTWDDVQVFSIADAPEGVNLTPEGCADVL